MNLFDKYDRAVTVTDMPLKDAIIGSLGVILFIAICLTISWFLWCLIDAIARRISRRQP